MLYGGRWLLHNGRYQRNGMRWRPRKRMFVFWILCNQVSRRRIKQAGTWHGTGEIRVAGLGWSLCDQQRILRGKM